MATFKQHKAKYCWLTNAHCTIFTSIAMLLTITSKVILDTFKLWARSTELGYRSFLKINTSLFWIVDSVIDATLNFPKAMNDIFVADITRCYELIPLHGEHNLLDAVTYIINTAFRHAAQDHPKSTTQLWVRFNADGTPTTTKWGTKEPGFGSWMALSAKRLLDLHCWLMTNCFIILGDHVWV
jgi:hypothetical protein